jgi:hypothetical protein
MTRQARTKVTISYRKAAKTPSARDRPVLRPPPPTAYRASQGLSPIAVYLEDNCDSGLSKAELIEQFQEYDCKHLIRETLADSLDYKIVVCKDCNKMEKKFRPGKKVEDG